MKYLKLSIKTIIMLFVLALGGSVQGQELQMLIKEALANNPEIKKFEAQYNQASEKVNEVQTVPNTEFGLGYFVSEPETRTGPQRFKVSAKQMLPWFGSITARENYSNALADAKYEDIVIAKRKLVAEVSQSYYTLYTNLAKQQILVENMELLLVYETLALNAVEAGKTSAVDVLRLQMRQNSITQSQQVLKQQYRAEEVNMNKLLNRSNHEALHLKAILDIPEASAEMNLDMLKVHPELSKYDKLYTSVEQSELLNQKERSPMIGFGVDYINVEKRPNMDFTDNGKDIFMPMLSLSIPVFNKKYKSKTKQNALQQEAILFEKQERYNRLETMLNKAVADREAARIQYETQKKNLEQAKDAEGILMKNYETGTIDFKDVLDIQELQLQFQMNQVEAVNNYYVQSSIINYLTS